MASERVGSTGNVVVGYGLAGEAGVQMLGTKTHTNVNGMTTSITNIRANDAKVINGVMYVSHGRFFSVYKYANNTLEEVQQILLPDMTLFSVDGSNGTHYMSQGHFTTFVYDEVNNNILIGASAYKTTTTGYNSAPYYILHLLYKGSIGVDGLVTLSSDPPQQILVVNDSPVNTTVPYSKLHMHNNLLLLTSINGVQSTDNTKHSVFTVDAAGVCTHVETIAANANAVNDSYETYGIATGFRAFEDVLFERVANRIWSTPFDASGFGTSTFNTVAESGLGFRLEDCSISKLSNGKYRLADMYQRGFTYGSLDVLDVDVTDWSNTSTTFMTVGDSSNPYIMYGSVRFDPDANKAIMFDTHYNDYGDRREPTKHAKVFDFDATQISGFPASAVPYGADNVIPYQGRVRTLELLASPLPVFAITPTPTPTTTVTPTPSTSVPPPTPSVTPSMSVGSVYAISYPGLIDPLIGSAGMTEIYSGSLDDGSRQVTIPFDAMFFGTNYGNDANGGVHVGSNGYVTFGFGSNAYTSLSASNPGRGILIGAGDTRMYKLYTATEDGGETFRIRFEGNDFNATDIFWEMTFFKTYRVIQLTTGTIVDGFLDGVSNGSAFSPTYNFASNKSYILSSEGDGSGWSVVEGAVRLSNEPQPSATPSPSVTPTPTPTVTPSPSVGSVSPYETLMLAAEPLHYWRANSLVGGELVDIVSGNNATQLETVNSTVSGGEGIGGAAYVVADYTWTENRGFQLDSTITIGNTDPFTFEAWLRCPTGPEGEDNWYGAILGDNVNWYGPQFYRQTGTSLIGMYFANGGGSPEAYVDVGQDWFHAVITSTGDGNAKWYINKNLVMTTPIFGGASLALGYIGTDVSADAFDGYLDEIAFYDKALDASTIANHYEEGYFAIHGSYPVPVYPTFDEATKDSQMTISNAGKTVSSFTGTNNVNARTNVILSGKQYFEFTVDAGNSSGWFDVGVIRNSDVLHTPNYISQNGNGAVIEGGIAYGGWWVNAGAYEITPSYPDPVIGSVVQICIDSDTKRMWYKLESEPTWANGGDPAAGTGYVAEWNSTESSMVLAVDLKNHTLTFRFSPDEFTGTPPTGFNPIEA